MPTDREELLERLTVERFGTYRRIAPESKSNYDSPALSVERTARLAAEVKAHEEK